MEYIYSDDYLRTELCNQSHLFYVDVSKGIVSLISNLTVEYENVDIILVILESPHVHEYRVNRPQAAQGNTGKQLNNHLINLLNNYQTAYSTFRISDGVYEVVVDNAIPYQCSRGVKTLYFRDVNWLHNWINKGYFKIFQDKISNINPEVIINLCTKGSHYNKNLKISSLTEEYLEKFLGYKPNFDVNISYNSTVIYDASYIAPKKRKIATKTTHSAFTQRAYYLKGFVQTAIDNCFTKNRIVGEVHPSSKKFSFSKFHPI